MVFTTLALQQWSKNWSSNFNATITSWQTSHQIRTFTLAWTCFNFLDLPYLSCQININIRILWAVDINMLRGVYFSRGVRRIFFFFKTNAASQQEHLDNAALYLIRVIFSPSPNETRRS